MKAGLAAEQEPAQKIIALLLAALMLVLVVAGFDYRWHGAAVPTWLVALAYFGVVMSFAVFFIVTKQNSYAASTIQVEPGQPVISAGLYGLVRHPDVFRRAFAGGLHATSARILPSAAGRSGTHLAPARRGALPKLNLPGYAEYCARVRSRLIPLIW